MKLVPFPVILAAKEFDPEAVEFVLRHFEGYIASKASVIYADQYGNTHSYVDDDLHYRGIITVFQAIANFHFGEPPNDFIF